MPKWFLTSAVRAEGMGWRNRLIDLEQFPDERIR